jgi:hypothetical protein
MAHEAGIVVRHMTARDNPRPASRSTNPENAGNRCIGAV